ncbi:alpha/beta hydrolase [Streptomyces sp. NPDC052042]|uniref:alpha/beta hydrolase n=1 Tax=Streptomyces sp. NPDC052042 TaxID=3365683 RepID=UPI0037D7B988
MSPAPERDGPKRYPPLTRALSVAALPLAPVFGLLLSYMLFHPPRRPHHKGPRDVGLPEPEELRVGIGGGKQVHAWLCPGDTDRIVVVGHGMGLSKSATLGHAKFLHDAGYTVCLFDHRNHGLSSQDRSVSGLSGKFTSDVLALVRLLRSREEYRSAKVAVYGFSFSTFPMLYSLRDDDCEVNAVICDSGPGLELDPLFRNFIDAKVLPIPAALRAMPARWALEGTLSSAGVAMLRSEWPPPVTGRYADTPLLFIAGEEDRILPASSVDGLAARYSHAEAHVLPGIGHLQGLKEAPEKYTSTVLDFLQRAMG